jgi:hypothetical protein
MQQSWFLRRLAILLATVLTGIWLASCSASPSGRAGEDANTSSLIALHCSESVGQQGRDHEISVDGVEGLVLPGSNQPASIYTIRSADGRRYFIYKAFLAVASFAAPFATVSVVKPGNAGLVYSSSGRIGSMFSSRNGEALVAASRRAVRLPVCGKRFTGFVGGIILARYSCVTFAVSSPHRRTETVSVAIGPSKCRS